MTGYDSKSCNALEKPFYRPVEVAIRWCGLIHQEAQILAALDPATNIPTAGQFPQWPCLQVNTEKVVHAILSAELPYGRDGKPVAPGETVRRDRQTVSHAHLKKWFIETQTARPTFLFDDVEQSLHPGVTVEAYQKLRAELDAAKAEVRSVRRERDELQDQVTALSGQLSTALAQTTSEDEGPQAERNRRNLWRVIAALAEIAGLPERGAAVAVTAQVERMSAQPPKEATVRKILEDARKFVADERKGN